MPQLSGMDYLYQLTLFIFSYSLCFGLVRYFLYKALRVSYFRKMIEQKLSVPIISIKTNQKVKTKK